MKRGKGSESAYSIHHLEFGGGCEHGDCCLLLSRDLESWLESPVVAGGGARARAVEQPRMSILSMSCGQTRAQAVLTRPAYWEEGP